MIELGQYNLLTANRKTEHGYYLVDDKNEEVLLPNKYVPEYLSEGEQIDVFVYLDSEERLIATNLAPKIKLYEYSYLKVVDVNDFGAYLDWGLEKDLFCPFREQNKEMKVGESYVVYMYLDGRTDRLVASGNYSKFLENEEIKLNEGEEVDLLICEKTDLGYNAIINSTYLGLIYENEIFKAIDIGDKIKGFVKCVREDDKIDLSLQKQGYENVEPNANMILKSLKKNDGFLPLNDKSSPEEIKKTLEISKKVFKKAIGSLYKDRVIRIETDGIYLA